VIRVLTNFSQKPINNRAIHQQKENNEAIKQKRIKQYMKISHKKSHLLMAFKFIINKK